MSRVTKVSKSRQLTMKQKNAIDLILQGNTDEEVSKSVGVVRSTVTEWRNHTPKFITGLNARREELWGGAIEKLRFLISKAVDVLAADLNNEDLKLRQAAAVHILRAVGLYGSTPSLPTKEENAPLTPDDIKELFAMAQECEQEWKREQPLDYDRNDRKQFIYHRNRRTSTKPQSTAAGFVVSGIAESQKR